MIKLLDKLAKYYLRRRNYFVRSFDLPKPKDGGTVTVVCGGAWSVNGHYYATGTASKLGKDHPLSKYGYIKVTAHKGKTLTHSGINHPYEIVEVE